MRERDRSGLGQARTIGGGAWRRGSTVAALLAGAAALAYWTQHETDPAPATLVAPVIAPANNAPASAVQAAADLPIATTTLIAAPGTPPPLAAPAVAQAQPTPAAVAQPLRDLELGLRDGAAPADTLRTAQTLSLCTMFRRDHGAFVASETMPPPENKAMEDFRQEVRRCQVLDASLLARAGEAYQRAYDGHAPGAASAYLFWLTFQQQGQADPQLLDKLRADVRQVVRSGDLVSLAGWSYASDDMALRQGFSLVEARAYREAWFQVVDIGVPGNSAAGRELAANMGLLAGPPLPAAQQLEVEALVRQIVEASRASRFPGS